MQVMLGTVDGPAPLVAERPVLNQKSLEEPQASLTSSLLCTVRDIIGWRCCPVVRRTWSARPPRHPRLKRNLWKLWVLRTAFQLAELFALGVLACASWLCPHPDVLLKQVVQVELLWDASCFFLAAWDVTKETLSIFQALCHVTRACEKRRFAQPQLHSRSQRQCREQSRGR